jgi:hypothetical protein
MRAEVLQEKSNEPADTPKKDRETPRNTPIANFLIDAIREYENCQDLHR